MSAADLGSPSSYVLAAKGLPVFSGDDDEIGKLLHVLADEQDDVFDGLVVETRVGAGGPRFVDAADVEEFFERGVRLRLTTGACGDLLRPTANPAALEAHGDSPPPSHLQARLRRAWDLLSGRG